VSEIMAKAMGFTVSSWTPDVLSNNLRKVIMLKNKHFSYQFKAGNSEYIYGRRREWAGGQLLPSELNEINSMVLRLDSMIWSGVKDFHFDMDMINSITSYSKEYEPLNHSQKSLDAEISQFILQDGYEINLFASEIDFPVANPVAITFDPRGRMWVASMPSYPHYYPGSPPDDKIVILEDTNLDGKADKHTVFADSLLLPLGFELGDGGVYVTQAPDLVFLKDTDGDGRADLRKILLTGFGTEDSHHAISAYTWGQDGALYMHEGTFLHSQIETPYGPKRGAYGTTWRYEPRTMKLDPYVSYFYANPWGNVFTRNGTHLIGDVSTGMNYFAPPLTVAIDYPRKHKQMKDFLTGPVRPKTCGMEIVSSRQFPESAQGNILFNTFIGFQGIRQHKISEDGSGIIAHETDPLLQSKDRNFRPVDLKFGPDGALYVVDWYDPIIQHGEQNFRDSLRDHTRGRIWRITYKNRKALQPVDLTQLSIGELLDQLKVFEDRTRYRARIQLREFSEHQVIPALDKWLLELNPAADPKYEYHRLEGLWVYQQFNHPVDGLLSDLLKSKDHHVRAAATRVLYYWNEQINDSEQKLIVMTQDAGMRVRMEAIAALSHFKSEASVNALLSTIELPTDDYIDYALDESFKQLKPIWMEMFKKDNEFLADEPEKARRLLQPFMSQKELDGPRYFIQDDPQQTLYSFNTFSQEDIKALSSVPAFINFRKNISPLDEDTNPDAVVQSESGSNPAAIVVNLSAIPGKMLFDKSTITIPAGKSISLIFENRDQMAHNVVIIIPGSTEKVGKAADDMAGLKDGYERNFVPDITEVVVATPLVAAGKTFQLNFKAPKEPGKYPFICSFPGHWRVMQGVINVTNDNSTATTKP